MILSDAPRAVMTVGPRILKLDQVCDQSVGGKAYGLSRLLDMGLAVPPAFVICQAQQDRFPENLDACSLELGEGKLAVRSSALGEDGSDASFAGQYDTVLNVDGAAELRQAINQCVASASSEHARDYLQNRSSHDDSSMNVVIQRMVDARVAGVVFTADPVSARRDLLLIDAVAGLGEALVSGEATPDHYAVETAGDIVRRQLAGEQALLNDHEIGLIAEQARSAARHQGQPLDLEWAIDKQGQLFWLQARPVTTLPADLNEFDSTLPRPDDVLTISNVSEMMPGAVCPLTTAFTGWGIDYGLQHMQVAVGARGSIDPAWQITASAYGHLFLNLTGNVVMGAGVLGSSVEQTAQTLCGRIVPELKELPPLPLWRRTINTVRLLRYCLRAPAVVDQFGRELPRFTIENKPDSRSMWAQIDSKSEFFNHAMAVHIQSSALSGFLCAIVENMVSGRSNDSTIEEQSEAVRLLAGASDVESALMLDQLDSLVDHIAAYPDVDGVFTSVSATQALAWLRATPGMVDEFEAFLSSHGHRGYRELCMRDPAWAEDATPLVQSMQAAVRARLVAGGHRHAQHSAIDLQALGRGLRWLLPKAHNAIRRREHTKSQLVAVGHHFKLAFRHLGQRLEEEGKLPDADLVNFFSVAEMPGLVQGPSSAAIAHAVARRAALPYQQQLEFPEISVGIPRPLQAEPLHMEEGILQGRPASRGVVEGIARVAHTLDEAAALQPGEILVTPITDIGWTPYFSMIGGLVTDLGSAVSHGAVIAREYGLPCVVNTRHATRVLNSGDRLRLDGDRGEVTVLSADKEHQDRGDLVGEPAL
jgi:phosphohistidine swiveling domain-containing protein